MIFPISPETAGRAALASDCVKNTRARRAGPDLKPARRKGGPRATGAGKARRPGRSQSARLFRPAPGQSVHLYTGGARGAELLNRLRGRLEPALSAVGRAFAATGLPPDFWTYLGLALALASAAAFASGLQHAALLGGALLLASGFFDVVDGQVARAAKKESRRGAFADSLSDKAAEAAVFVGIMAGALAEPLLVAAALSLSLLVSYARARAESLGVRLSGVGIGERAERLLTLAVVGMFWMEAAVAAVAAVAAITLAHRAVSVARRL